MIIMKVSIILAHPDSGSFNHAIANKARKTLERNGHDAVFHDLYLEGFDPLLTREEIPKTAPLGPLIQSHCEETHNADGIIIIHPNWWGMPPAILKGWVD
jgi:NAD(P)H dehydrogenase (quinone)